MPLQRRPANALQRVIKKFIKKQKLATNIKIPNKIIITPPDKTYMHNKFNLFLSLKKTKNSIIMNYFIYWKNLKTGLCGNGSCILSEKNAKSFAEAYNTRDGSEYLYKYAPWCKYYNIIKNLPEQF